MNKLQRFGWDVRARVSDLWRRYKTRFRKWRNPDHRHYTLEIPKVAHNHRARLYRAHKARAMYGKERTQ